jgi:hypothetical protein
LWIIHGGRLHADRTIGFHHRQSAALWLQAEEDWIYTFMVCMAKGIEVLLRYIGGDAENCFSSIEFPDVRKLIWAIDFLYELCLANLHRRLFVVL